MDSTASFEYLRVLRWASLCFCFLVHCYPFVFFRWLIAVYISLKTDSLFIQKTVRKINSGSTTPLKLSGGKPKWCYLCCLPSCKTLQNTILWGELWRGQAQPCPRSIGRLTTFQFMSSVIRILEKSLYHSNQWDFPKMGFFLALIYNLSYEDNISLLTLSHHWDRLVEWQWLGVSRSINTEQLCGQGPMLSTATHTEKMCDSEPWPLHSWAPHNFRGREEIKCINGGWAWGCAWCLGAGMFKCDSALWVIPPESEKT